MKKVIKIGLLCIFIMIVIFLIVTIINNSKQADEIREVAQKLECKYINIASSYESGFEKDVFLEIPYLPVESSKGENNQYYYEKLITAITSKMNKINYRIIDENKNLIIRIRYDGEKSSYTINGDNNYYQTQKAKLLKSESEKTINLSVKSNELNTIIDSDWIRKRAVKSLGTLESTCNSYDYYYDEGYKIKTVNLDIFNVIFTEKYVDEVFDGIKTGMENTKIKEILGNPQYENEDANFLIGYKTDNFYVFFSEGEISIYRIEEFDEEKNKQFAQLVTAFTQNGDYRELTQKVTEIYPDYVEYERDNNIKLAYPQRGFSIEYNKNNKGITIFKNYKGKITNELSIDNIEGDKRLPKVIYIEGEDYIFKTELDRASKEYIIRKNNEQNSKVKNNSELFSIKNQNNIYRFYSKDKKSCDSEIDDENITSIINYNDDKFIIGKNNDGIFEYNAITREMRKILDVNGECNLVAIEDNKLYYNSTYINL